MKFVAVSSCLVGMAHSYMAQKAMTTYAKDNGLDLKVEVQGTLGFENKLTQEEIDEADVVIFAIDVTVNEQGRFEGKKIVQVIPGEAIRHPKELFDKAIALAQE